MGKTKTHGARILLLDIETAPNLGYFWSLWGQDIPTNMVKKRGYMLCWSAKWLGEKKIYSDALINYTNKPDNLDIVEKTIANSIHELMDEAHIIVTHNGNNFDLRWLNSVFLRNRLKPVSSYKSVDTRLEAKKNFRFISNKLDYLCRELSLGKKLDTEGFSLWEGCMECNKKAWKKMVKYNKHDVVMLEDLYKTIRPFIKKHPNLSLYTDTDHNVCSGCEGTEFKPKGYYYLSAGKYQRWQCVNCGKYTRGGSNLLSKDKRKGLGRQV